MAASSSMVLTMQEKLLSSPAASLSERQIEETSVHAPVDWGAKHQSWDRKKLTPGIGEVIDKEIFSKAVVMPLASTGVDYSLRYAAIMALTWPVLTERDMEGLIDLEADLPIIITMLRTKNILHREVTEAIAQPIVYDAVGSCAFGETTEGIGSLMRQVLAQPEQKVITVQRLLELIYHTRLRLLQMWFHKMFSSQIQEQSTVLYAPSVEGSSQNKGGQDQLHSNCTVLAKTSVVFDSTTRGGLVFTSSEKWVYYLRKLATPARYAVTVGGTSIAVKYLRKHGYISTPPPVKEYIQDRMEETKERLSGKMEETRDMISEKMEETKEMLTGKMEETKERLTGKMEETKGRITEKIQETKEKVSFIKKKE
ncbi:UNVERIFIED_CONTAM: hypothetical protein K2H54_053740 [Gekko kuhli]